MYISGELLQSLAEVTVTTKDKLKGHKKVNNFVNKKIIIDTDKEFSNENKSMINNYKIIFVYSDFLEYFFNKIMNHINNKFILISHNGDIGANSHFITYLSNEKLVKWYSNNIYFNHDKLVALPIGIANSQWKHGNMNLLEKIINQKNKKTNLLHANFSLKTAECRKNIKNIIENNFGKIYNKKTSQEEYLIELSKNKFCLSPPGNGIDCHRTWEALYLGVIPIVKSHPHNLYFQNLPILIVNDWNILTPNYLNKMYDEFQKKEFDMNFLTIEYWKSLIQNNNLI